MRFRFIFIIGSLLASFTLSAFGDLTDCLPSGPGASRTYPEFSMREKYVKSDAEKGVKYYETPEAQASLKRAVRDGKFEMTSGGRGSFFNGSIVYLYVMDRSGSFYFIKDAPSILSTPVHHSTLLAGQPVACAGMIKLGSDGSVSYISTASGHYVPVKEQLRTALDSLYRQGFDLTHTVIEFGGTKNTIRRGKNQASTESALSYLFHSDESRRCIGEKLRKTEADVKDLRELHSVSRFDFEDFVVEMNARGRISEYREALIAFLMEDREAREFSSPKVLAAIEMPERQKFCQRLLQFFR